MRQPHRSLKRVLVSSFFLVDRSIVAVTSLRGSVVQDYVDQ